MTGRDLENEEYNKQINYKSSKWEMRLIDEMNL